MENENNSISEGALVGIPKSKLRESKSRHSHVTRGGGGGGWGLGSCKHSNSN